MTSYAKRRYKIEHGILVKSWDGDKEGWYTTKEEAWAAVEPETPKPTETLKLPETFEEKPKTKRRGRPRKK